MPYALKAGLEILLCCGIVVLLLLMFVGIACILAMRIPKEQFEEAMRITPIVPEEIKKEAVRVVNELRNAWYNRF